MPRVTEIIDALTEKELLNWYLRLGKTACKKISDEALRVGTVVDSLVQQDIKDGGYLMPEGDPKIESCLKAWELFKKDYPSFVPSIIEMQTELQDEDVIGHPDFIHLNGITDLKCSSGIRPRYWTQISEYYSMRFRDSHVWGNGFVAVLRLDKETGLYEYKKIDDPSFIEYEVKVFDAYLTAFKHNENVREVLRKQLEAELLED